MNEPTQTFLEALDRLEVGWTRTGAGAVTSTLREVIAEPAVGASLPFGGLTLDGTGVTVDPTPAELEAARTGVTAAHLGIASYGSIVIQGGPDATEAASLFPERHVAVLRATDIVPDMSAALQELGPALRETATTAILATGPSATADMGALVRGAHGPEHVHVIIVAEP
ncbi:MAG: LUD domain-containing protein [Salinibacter sp.]